MRLKFSNIAPCAIGLIAALFALATEHSAQAQQAQKFEPVSIVVGSIDSSNKRLMNDLKSMIRSKSPMRLAPVLGMGSAHDVLTLIYSEQVEVGMIHTDVLNMAKRQPQLYPDVEKLIRLISHISLDEIHVIAHHSIRDISELEGKVVNFGPGTQRTFSSPYLLFEALEIPVRRVALSQTEAIKRIKTGEVAATVIAAAMPHATVMRLSAKDGVHLLSVKLTERLTKDYAPVQIGSSDYPELIKGGRSIETVAVANVMITREWPPDHHRSRKLAAFVDALFSNFDTLREKRYHPKWRDANIAVRVPGWTRFAPADAWMGQYEPQVSTLPGLRDDFEKFLELWRVSKGANKTETDAMFKRFQTWQTQQSK